MNDFLIWHISDTHCLHSGLRIPNADLVIHSGDESNSHGQYSNKPEFLDFIKWYSFVRIKHKILVPGNHSSFIYNNQKEARKICEENNIILLIDESVEVEGIKIWGSPITPTFMEWYFMRDRSKTMKTWEKIPQSCEIVVTHGPPKGILDLSVDRKGNFEQCGDKALLTRIGMLFDVKLHLYGHVHSNRDGCRNQGVLFQDGIYFSNASCVEDGEMTKLSSHGNLFSFDKSKRAVTLVS